MEILESITERRRIEGRHDGHLFSVEAWQRIDSQAFVHRVDVEGIPVPAGHLLVQSGMTAALEAGAALARNFIDARSL